MPRPRHLTTALPRGLREELGIKDRYGEKKRNNSRPMTRKERRKDERQGNRQTQRAKNTNYRGRDPVDDEEEELDEEDSEEETEIKVARSEDKRVAAKKSLKSQKAQTSEEQPISKTAKLSKTVKHQLEQDDEEIKALEKRLGLKGRKKLPKAFEEEGLADLLGDLNDDSEMEDNKKRKREEQDWLQRKRRKAQGLEVEEGDSETESWDGLESGSVATNSDDEADLLEDDEYPDSDEASEIEGSGSDDLRSSDEVDQPEQKRVRENPFVPPVTTPTASTKYIPPSMRLNAKDGSNEDVRLRRQAQGLLNKLSEANLISILTDIEKLYREYPRQSVTSTLVSLLLNLVTDRTSLEDTFIILHAGFIAGMYKIVGIDFGAIIVQNLVETFDKSADDRGPFTGKEHLNLMSLLSQLYNFNVIGSNLVFDYIRLFLQQITEPNTELLLKIIRNSGPQLRQDDPSALKDIVLLVQPAVARIGEDSLSVRTKFMIETITNLKNNRMKTGLAASSILSEHITKMRKILGSLNNRNIRASEPIRVSRKDIQDSEGKGKWWLVGASWKESDPLEAARQALSDSTMAGLTGQKPADQDSDGEPDLVSIARAHSMNTDIRRSIFIAIMSATDYRDAHVRLMKLHLKRNQEYEIPRVLVKCAMGEEAYNPYYGLIARRLCGEMGRRLKMSFMFTLWDVFKRMGENHDGEDEDGDDEFRGFDQDDNLKDGTLSLKSVVNLSKMFATLVSDGSLDLAILKNLNFAYLKPKTSMFMEILIVTIIQQSQVSATRQKKSTAQKKQIENEDEEKYRQALLLSSIFSKTHQVAPHIVKGLVFFIRKTVLKSDIMSSKKEKKLVKWGCSVALDALNGIDTRDV